MTTPFALYVSSNDRVAYLKRYQQQLTIFADTIKKQPLTTIFFGRTDDSALSADFISFILTETKKYFSFADDCEVTLEIFPTDIKFLEDYKKSGVTRASLKTYNAQAHEKIAQTFKNYNLDLTYGEVGVSIHDWRQMLKTIMALNPPHVSVVEAEAIKTYASGVMFYDAASTTFKENGYDQDDLTHFSRPDFHSRYLRCYLALYPYMGIGPDAVGVFQNKTGETLLSRGDSANAWAEDISGPGLSMSIVPEDERLEMFLQQGLKSPYGISKDRFEAFVGKPFDGAFDAKILADLVSYGLLEVSTTAIRPTAEGLLKTNGILDLLLKGQSPS